MAPMVISSISKLIVATLAVLTPTNVSAFVPSRATTFSTRHTYYNDFSKTELALFDKLFEEEGTLGKGITVGKISVALRSPDRSDSSIFGLLESHASDDSDANEDLSRMANSVCLDLMRKSDDWVAACSTSKWFSGNDSGKAASYYNDLCNNIAIKFEKVRLRRVSQWLLSLSLLSLLYSHSVSTL